MGSATISGRCPSVKRNRGIWVFWGLFALYFPENVRSVFPVSLEGRERPIDQRQENALFPWGGAKKGRLGPILRVRWSPLSSNLLKDIQLPLNLSKPPEVCRSAGPWNLFRWSQSPSFTWADAPG